MRGLRFATGIAHGLVLVLSLAAGTHAALSAHAGRLPGAALDSRLVYGAEVAGVLALIGMLLVMIAVRGVIHGQIPVRIRDVEYPVDPAHDRLFLAQERDISELQRKVRWLEALATFDNPHEGD